MDSHLSMRKEILRFSDRPLILLDGYKQLELNQLGCIFMNSCRDAYNLKASSCISTPAPKFQFGIDKSPYCNTDVFVFLS